MKTRDLGKLALTSALGLFLSSSFIFLAALPIRYLRIGFGRLPFMLVTLLGAGALFAYEQWQWGLVYVSLSFLIGSYSELELQKIPLFISAAISIFLTSVFSAFAFGVVARQKGFTLITFLQQQLEPLQQQLQGMPQFEGITEWQSFLLYLPSGLIISLMLILFITLSVFSDSTGTKNSRVLKSFRLPDQLIWVFIISLAGSFLLEKGSIETTVAFNIFTVTAAAYFFQGLAVTACYLDFYQVFGFWRMLVYFLIFFQMFIVICGVGILDFWLDFRARLQLQKKLNSRREERS